MCQNNCYNNSCYCICCYENDQLHNKLDESNDVIEEWSGLFSDVFNQLEEERDINKYIFDRLASTAPNRKENELHLRSTLNIILEALNTILKDENSHLSHSSLLKINSVNNQLRTIINEHFSDS